MSHDTDSLYHIKKNRPVFLEIYFGYKAKLGMKTASVNIESSHNMLMESHRLIGFMVIQNLFQF